MNSNPTNSMTSSESRPEAAAGIHGTLENLKPYGTIGLNLSAELGRGKISLRDLLKLQYHSVFPLDRPAGAKLALYVNGCPLGTCEPVIIEDRKGIKVDELFDPY